MFRVICLFKVKNLKSDKKSNRSAWPGLLIVICFIFFPCLIKPGLAFAEVFTENNHCISMNGKLISKNFPVSS